MEMSLTNCDHPTLRRMSDGRVTCDDCDRVWYVDDPGHGVEIAAMLQAREANIVKHLRARHAEITENGCTLYGRAADVIERMRAVLTAISRRSAPTTRSHDQSVTDMNLIWHAARAALAAEPVAIQGNRGLPGKTEGDPAVYERQRCARIAEICKLEGAIPFHDIGHTLIDVDQARKQIAAAILRDE